MCMTDDQDEQHPHSQPTELETQASRQHEHATNTLILFHGLGFFPPRKSDDCLLFGSQYVIFRKTPLIWLLSLQFV